MTELRVRKLKPSRKSNRGIRYLHAVVHGHDQFLQPVSYPIEYPINWRKAKRLARKGVKTGA